MATAAVKHIYSRQTTTAVKHFRVVVASERIIEILMEKNKD